MFARILSAAVVGIDARAIEVQCDVAGGLPAFQIVGLPEKEVTESRERVRSALRNAGFAFPPGRITANLAPADMKKEGVGFDLPVAVGILVASRQLRPPPLETVLVGELALDGAVRGVRGILPMAMSAKESGATTLIVPALNAEEAALVGGLDVIPVRSLQEATRFLRGELVIRTVHVDPEVLLARAHEASPNDLRNVRGQLQAKRALEVAAAGGHNLLLVGPPGAGKSMLARSLPGILPPLSLAEALDVTRIYSSAGLIESGLSLVCTRPFRAPHHTISYACMVGGGHGDPGPGEISLAHHGVLFLDETPEFDRRVLETLRQPLEERSILLSRAGVSVRYPCSFTLVAAMNPCPCGYLGDSGRECVCGAEQVRRYRRRLSGPFLDRIDMVAEVPRLSRQELTGRPMGEPSSAVRVRVGRARAIQWARFADAPDVACNAHLEAADLARCCELGAPARHLLEQAIDRYSLSARAYVRALKVARTIADLEGCEAMEAQHIAEAIQYRIAGEH
ncbi:MAG: YifB family Mg chelatase-like AAA ATPase [Candidatus Bipolaricaulota bacterium]|nr:MAG: YifB family Mg chelatase-like AAA ATPase [Candidatus Bipolaricaulota bacterium]